MHITWTSYFFAKSTPYSFPTLGTGKLSILVGSTKWGVVNLCTYISGPLVNHLVSIKTWPIFSLSCKVLYKSEKYLQASNNITHEFLTFSSSKLKALKENC
jgi:hypothetical protein